MKINLARPPATYSQGDEAQTRHAIAQALSIMATTSQLGADAAVLFADLPVGAPAGTRRFVIDRGAFGKPLWWDGSAHWVDGAGTVVT